MLRNGLMAVVVFASVFAASQWGTAQAGTVPAISTTCDKLSLAPVTVSTTSGIYYATTSTALISGLTIKAGQTFRVCEDFSNPGWVAFYLAPGSTLPLYVKKGVFAGR